MGWLGWTLITITVIMVIAFIVLSILGKKMQKKNDAAMAELRAHSQNVSMLVIDKKRMKLKDAGFPQAVVDQTPKFARNQKVAVVKAKIGPQIHTLMCDEKVFEFIPVKKEVKATLGGIYILDVKGMRGALQKDETTKKKGFFSRFKKNK